MSDIVERLRHCANPPTIAEATNPWPLITEAADEIERLRAGGCARNQGITQYCAEVADAVRAEREACARIADALAESHEIWATKVVHYNLRAHDCRDIAAAIRARTGMERPPQNAPDSHEQERNESS